VLQRELEQAVDRASDFYDTTLKSVAELMRLGFKRGEIAERLELSNMQTRLMMSKVTYKLSVGLALFNPERKEE
jgi:DNA-binding NarL/FixJ family response regulator